MLRILHAALAALCALVAGSCAAPTIPEGTPTGWIVVSVARDTLEYTAMRIRVASVEKGGFARALGFPALPGETNPPMHKFGAKTVYVAAERFPAGRYHIVNFQLDYLLGNRYFNAASNFSVPLEVKANEVVYLGELLGAGTTYKPVILVPQIDKAYFVVSERRSRDMDIAVREHPALAGLPVHGVRIADSNGFFRSTRLPD